MFAAYNEELLRLLASHGEMPIREFLLKVKRLRNDYTDFYGVAAMLHGDYMSTDTTTDSAGEKTRGTLGINTLDSAVALCQITLEPGESFMLNDCPRDSWYDFTAKIFITSQGFLKLEELDDKNSSKVQKRLDYVFAIFIAILAAIAGGIATSYFSLAPQCTQSNQESAPLTTRSTTFAPLTGLAKATLLLAG
jgi:hypothetical protein